MHLYVKQIKGKNYIYAEESIYIAKGRILKISKSFGRKEESTLPDKIRKTGLFNLYIEDLEAKERSDFWISKIKQKKSFTKEKVRNLEILRTKFYRKKAKLGEMGGFAMDRPL